MKKNTLKMLLEISLSGNNSVKITATYLHDDIKNNQNDLLFKTKYGFSFKKSNYQGFIKSEFIFNMKNNFGVKYDFVHNNIRKDYLKTLKINLLELTKSNIFNDNKSSRIVHYDKYWFVY